MKYDFDKFVDRSNTNSIKWDYLKKIYGKEDLISMWVADSDFEVPPFVSEALKKRAEHPVYGYTHRPKAFYQSVINWLEKRHQWKVKKDWIITTPGVVAALNWAVMTYTEPNDKIIIQPPVYYPFFNSVTNNNRVLVENPLKVENGRYVMDIDDLRDKIDDKTKMIILCSPHNPVGRVWSKEELEELGNICIENNIIIVSDEIHSDLILDDNKHYPISNISEELNNLTITCMAPSKTFNIAGLETSIAIIPNDELRKQFEHTQTCLGAGMSNIFGIEAFFAAYTHGEEWLEELLSYLQNNVEYFIQFVESKLPKMKVIKPEGTYLLWLDCNELGLSDKELKQFFVEEAKLAVNYGYIFGETGKGFVRFNLATRLGLIKEALINLEDAYAKRF